MVLMSLLGFIVVIALMVGAVKVAEKYQSNLELSKKPVGNRKERRKKK